MYTQRNAFLTQPNSKKKFRGPWFIKKFRKHCHKLQRGTTGNAPKQNWFSKKQISNIMRGY